MPTLPLLVSTSWRSCWAPSPVRVVTCNACTLLCEAVSALQPCVYGVAAMLTLLAFFVATLVEALIIPGYHIGHNKHAVPAGCFAVSTTARMHLCHAGV